MPSIQMLRITERATGDNRALSFKSQVVQLFLSPFLLNKPQDPGLGSGSCDHPIQQWEWQAVKMGNS